MKYTIILTIGFMTLSTQAFALDLLGPPGASVKKGQCNFGVEYVHGESDVDVEGVFGLTDTIIDDVEMNKIYGLISCGPTENCELFVRLGAVDVEVDRGSNTDNLGYYIGGSDFNFAIGGGTKVTMVKSDNIQWGLIAQLSYADITDFDGASGTILGSPASLSAEAEVLEFQVALGPTVDLTDNTSIYGGALFHFLDGEADLKGTLGGASATATSDLKQDSVLGGYLGLGFQIADNSSLNIEYQFTGDSYFLGVGMVFKFGQTSPNISETNRLKDELRMIEEIDPNKKLLGYRVETDEYGRRTKIPVYEHEQKK